ncbi:ubiquitin-like-conjugating enzyme ATG10 [Aedes aegypti]|uniref:Ubiquitin-like-conjugating enzyme ATG10 n=1 Tax=Aedes aegypti TaxID=7159 RepID=A0A6I8TZ43_AEDAE|nr:ubiquitin-like-conjugating enzyme ATG10 [Aedes aegypti]
MTTGTLTEEQFRDAAERFLERSHRIGDDWELVKSENGTYLTKRLKQTLKKEKAETAGEDEELIVDDPSLGRPTPSDEDVYQFEYHVVYSVSYQVPVLYFNAYKSDGTMLRLEEAWQGFRDLASESREQLRRTLTQMEHPILFRPFLALHPCRTAQVLGNVATGCGNLLVAFISSYGPFVNLNLDVRYAALAK